MFSVIFLLLITVFSIFRVILSDNITVTSQFSFIDINSNDNSSHDSDLSNNYYSSGESKTIMWSDLITIFDSASSGYMENNEFYNLFLDGIITIDSSYINVSDIAVLTNYTLSLHLNEYSGSKSSRKNILNSFDNLGYELREFVITDKVDVGLINDNLYIVDTDDNLVKYAKSKTVISLLKNKLETLNKHYTIYETFKNYTNDTLYNDFSGYKEYMANNADISKELENASQILNTLDLQILDFYSSDSLTLGLGYDDDFQGYYRHLHDEIEISKAAQLASNNYQIVTYQENLELILTETQVTLRDNELLGFEHSNYSNRDYSEISNSILEVEKSLNEINDFLLGMPLTSPQNISTSLPIYLSLFFQIVVAALVAFTVPIFIVLFKADFN